METDRREDLFTIPQAAEYADVPVRTIYHAVKRGFVAITWIAGKKFLTRGAVDDWKSNPVYHRPGPKGM